MIEKLHSRTIPLVSYEGVTTGLLIDAYCSIHSGAKGSIRRKCPEFHAYWALFCIKVALVTEVT